MNTPEASTWTILIIPENCKKCFQQSLNQEETNPRPRLVYPNQNNTGSIIMKNVWVPRLAVSAKYESRNGVLQCFYLHEAS